MIPENEDAVCLLEDYGEQYKTEERRETMSTEPTRIGKSGTFNIPLKGADPEEGFSIPIRIIDERKLCGRVDVKVKPEHGTGAAWIKLVNIKLPE